MELNNKIFNILPTDIIVEVFNNASLEELRLLAQLNVTWSNVSYDYWKNRMENELLPTYSYIYTLNEYVKIKNAMEQAELTIKKEGPYIYFYFDSNQDITQIIPMEYLPEYGDGYDVSLNFEGIGLGKEKMLIIDKEYRESYPGSYVYKKHSDDIDVNDIIQYIIDIFYYYPNISHHSTNNYYGYTKK